MAHIYCLPGATCAAAGLTNLAFTAETINLAGDLVTIGVYERRMGGGDLNGDGDIRDLVVNVYDAATTITTNTGRSVQRNCLSQLVAVAEGCFGVRGDNVIMFTRERDQGRTDLNGDMDFRDRVIELWRLSTATLSSSGTAAFLRGGLALGNAIAAFRRSERQERLDLNGDGDKRDLVLAVYDSASLMVTTLSSAEAPFLIEGDTVVLRTREGVEATDLNADTDFDDGILQYQAF